MSPTSSPPPSSAIASPLWTDARRHALFTPWLAGLQGAHALLPDSVRLASADASFRRYLRVDTAAGHSLVVMDAPPDKENCQAFVQVAALMAEAGLRAPQVMAWGQANGFMLLTDLGT